MDVFAGDLKYKLAEDGRGRSADYYQLFAYLTARDLRKGVLNYCQTTEEAPLRRIDVVHSNRPLTISPDGFASKPPSGPPATAETAFL